ncbi:MAG: lipid-A-disaccharide synthase [Flavobacteriales bacterium]|nr:lipid-A-disaccharide synthase [Flavobacteriales bacterium]
MGKRIYIIAGEASGDLHGGNLVRELVNVSKEWRVAGGESASAAPSAAEEAADSPLATHNSPLVIRAWGGERMAAAGAEVVKHYRELAFMGFTQVIMNLRTILRNIDTCKKDIEAFKPDALILIDYPGFNLRIAEWAHAKGIPVHYYISPQVWAWKKGRVHTIKKVVDRMYVILPFEKPWYAQYGMDVDFVGHPLLDAIEQEGRTPLTALPGDDGRPVVALLPGSRRQEIARMLPLMVQVAKRFPQQRFVLAAAPSVLPEVYAEGIGNAPITVVSGRTYDVLRTARAALVTSGTATLETALFGVPEAVCYSGSALNVWIAKRLVDIKFISLVNLIMDREVVRELIQSDLTVDSLSAELQRLLDDGPYRERMVGDLRDLQQRLGGPGASAKVASAVWKSMLGWS